MLFFSAIRYSGKQVGRYILERPIGEGRYGVCFLARSDLGERVVIKKFKSSFFNRNSQKNIDEAVILSKLKDRRIPELLGVINQNGFYGFVLEFKQGCTLKDQLFKDRHEFSNKEFFNIGLQLIQILKYLHENGVVHRDIRIPNVLLDQGKVYLIDFGLARWAECNRYPYDLDFSYLGNFLLYLLYSSYQKGGKKELPWYEELGITEKQKLFLKKLLGLEEIYENINNVETDFIKVFKA